MHSSSLDTFITVCKTMNFSRAAEILYITQSTVSSRIRSLEEELNVELFRRSNTGLSLTPAGEYFLDQAIEIQDLIKSVEENMFLFDQFESHITVCAPESVWKHSLNNVISHYQKLHRTTAFKLISGNSEYVVQNLFNGSVDLGVVFYQVSADEIQTVPYDESIFYMTGCPEIAAAIKNITPKNIFNYPFIYCDWGPALTMWYNAHYRKKAHFCEIEGTSLFVRHLLEGRGIGFLPSRIADSYFESGQLVNIPYAFSESAPVDKAYLVYSSKNYSKVKPFVDLAERVVNVIRG